MIPLNSTKSVSSLVGGSLKFGGTLEPRPLGTGAWLRPQKHATVHICYQTNQKFVTYRSDSLDISRASQTLGDTVALTPWDGVADTLETRSCPPGKTVGP